MTIGTNGSKSRRVWIDYRSDCSFALLSDYVDLHSSEQEGKKNTEGDTSLTNEYFTRV